ncbi:MAG: shikimate kinase, partial [Lachnospiraceae bacterium]|nr:shikimate kinase [Lachnospiraceae bacterium]
MGNKHKKNREYEKGPHLILIGFMGSGKTSIGRGLSYKLQRAFCDTDKMIEAKEGMSISEIFASKGESAFRMMETDVLRSIRDDASPKIYSLGGGTPVQLQNQPLIKMCGTVCYLRITPEAVYERLKGDRTRPLLQCDDPLDRIRKLMAQRLPAYERCADVIVDT